MFLVPGADQYIDDNKITIAYFPSKPFVRICHTNWQQMEIFTYCTSVKLYLSYMYHQCSGLNFISWINQGQYLGFTWFKLLKHVSVSPLYSK